MRTPDAKKRRPPSPSSNDSSGNSDEAQSSLESSSVADTPMRTTVHVGSSSGSAGTAQLDASARMTAYVAKINNDFVVVLAKSGSYVETIHARIEQSARQDVEFQQASNVFLEDPMVLNQPWWKFEPDRSLEVLAFETSLFFIH